LMRVEDVSTNLQILLKLTLTIMVVANTSPLLNGNIWNTFLLNRPIYVTMKVPLI
jgi:hypothetical protein